MLRYTFKELIENQNSAPFLSREEMLKILQREEYGFLPPKPEKVTFEVTEETKIFAAPKQSTIKYRRTV